MSTKIGHGMAKALGIKLDYRNEIGLEKEKVSRGESAFSVESADTYVEAEPTAGEWFAEHTPSRWDVLRYFRSLFPFTHWIHRYNAQWLVGDLIAGEKGRNSSPSLKVEEVNLRIGRYYDWCCGCSSGHGLREAG